MALTGFIEDFGLADVLQLLVQRGKSGTILLTNEGDELRAAIEGGAIVAVENLGRPIESELASRLARSGFMTTTQLGLALKERANTEEPISRILVRLRFVAPGVVRAFASAQAMDALLDVFAWPKGKYAFVDGGLDGLVRSIDPIGMDRLLLTVIRSMDESPEIERVVPSLTARVEQIRPLPDAPADEHGEGLTSMLGEDRGPVVDDLFGDGEGSPQELGREARTLFALSRGLPSVRALLERAPLSRFEALRALADLVLAGYVRLS